MRIGFRVTLKEAVAIMGAVSITSWDIAMSIAYEIQAQEWEFAVIIPLVDILTVALIEELLH